MTIRFAFLLIKIQNDALIRHNHIHFNTFTRSAGIVTFSNYFIMTLFPIPALHPPKLEHYIKATHYTYWRGNHLQNDVHLIR